MNKNQAEQFYEQDKFAEQIHAAYEAGEKGITAMSDEYILVPRELLEELAPSQPMNQDEQGGCVWCNGSPEPYGYASDDPKDHTNTCPWLKARELLAEEDDINYPIDFDQIDRMMGL